jgi:hypothetical protein
MATISTNVTAQGPDAEESYGVLVGWTHHQFNGRVDLNLQAKQSTRRNAADDVDSHHFIMTKSQAAVLANYLLDVTNQKPPRRRGLLGRLFGV